MPSYARSHQLRNSLTYHLYNRSSGGEFIFKDNQDNEFFKHLLVRYSEEFLLMIYHWVIMSNHYHLLLEIDEPENISPFMAGLNRSYTYYHHRKYADSGYLWQGRFKAQPVQKENYLLACGRYIERNPVRAGIAGSCSEYRYSSAGFYCSGNVDGLTAENPLFCQFGQTKETQRTSYQNFLLKFDNETDAKFAALEEPVGDKEFIKKLLRVNGQYVSRRQGRKPGKICYTT